MDDAAAVADLLDERPQLEASLEAVLAVDEQHEEWTFDDVPIDSGEFGELVSHGLVEGTGDGDGYRVSDPAAARAALNDDSTGEQTDETTDETGAVDLSSVSREAISDRLDGVDRLQVGALLGALLAVVLARAYVYPSVFRDGAVVLSGNDPYYYRYWVEQALAGSGGVLDFSSLATMPEAVRTGEPLLVATLWLFASLVGGDATAAGWVLAWYPVVAAVITACLLYFLTMRVSGDRRVTLAAVLLLAVTPAHALRTSLGFADHHAFDYVWLLATAYLLVRLDRDRLSSWRNYRTLPLVGLFGVSVAGQILAWEAGPLLTIPLGLYVVLGVLDDVRSNISPLQSNIPLVGGASVAALLVYAIHSTVNLQTSTVALAPSLLLVGIVVVLVVAEAVHRFEAGVKVLVAIEGVGAVVGIVLFQALVPGYWSEIAAGFERIAATRNIAETQALLSGDALGWLLLFGFVLVLSIPYLVWASWRTYTGDRTWLVPVIYCWYFLALAMFQVRFAGQLSLFAAVFAGLGFVHLAATVDLTDYPAFDEQNRTDRSISLPERHTVTYLSVLFLFVASLSLIQAPIKISQITTDQETYQTATWIDDYSNDHQLSYPENYVLSPWGQNRMYNYFVNGESGSYWFALQNYESLLNTTDDRSWYLEYGDRVGFVVTQDQAARYGSLYQRLHESYGTGTESQEPLTRFQAVYSSSDRTVKVFRPVPGSIVTVGGLEGNRTELSSEISIPGANFTYARNVTVTQNGWAAARVPYATTYATKDGTVTVSSADVERGGLLSDQRPRAHWRFDEGRGDYVFDSVGGNHGFVENGKWGPGITNGSLVVNDTRSARVSNPASRDDSRSLTLSLWFRTDPDIDYRDSRPYPRIAAAAPKSKYSATSGYQIGLSQGRVIGILGDGSNAARVHTGLVDDGRWHHVALVWNGTHTSIYLDGRRTDVATYDGIHPKDHRLVFGASSDGKNHFVGRIDEARYFDRVVSETEIQQMATGPRSRNQTAS